MATQKKPAAKKAVPAKKAAAKKVAAKKLVAKKVVAKKAAPKKPVPRSVVKAAPPPPARALTSSAPRPAKAGPVAGKADPSGAGASSPEISGYKDVASVAVNEQGEVVLVTAAGVQVPISELMSSDIEVVVRLSPGQATNTVLTPGIRNAFAALSAYVEATSTRPQVFVACCPMFP